MFIWKVSVGFKINLESASHVMWFHISTIYKIIFFFQNHSKLLIAITLRHWHLQRRSLSISDRDWIEMEILATVIRFQIYFSSPQTNQLGGCCQKKKLLFQTTTPPIAITILEHLRPPASGGTPSRYQTPLLDPWYQTTGRRSTRCQTWLTTWPAGIRMVYQVSAGNIRGITGECRNKQGNFMGIWWLLSNKPQINYYIYVKKHKIS